MIFKKDSFEPMQINIPTMPQVYTKKTIDLGLGLAPIKPDFMSNSEYGAKCMLEGYKFAKEKYKKKYKKQIKKLKAELKAANEKPLGVLKAIEENDIKGLSFVFDPMQQEEEK